MLENISKVQRWLDLITYLIGHHFPVPVDELRALGIPLETVTHSIHHGMEEEQGYRISQSDFYLPYLKLVKELRRPDPVAQRPSTEPLSPDQADLFNVTLDGSIEIP